jgi:hypothetical protein
MTLPEQGKKHLIPKFQRLWPRGIKEQSRFNSQAYLLYTYATRREYVSRKSLPRPKTLPLLVEGTCYLQKSYAIHTPAQKS